MTRKPRRTTRVGDPGPSPLDVPSPDDQLRRRPWPRYWKRGTTRVCSHCGGTMVARDDLIERVDVAGQVHVFHDLCGGRCTDCGAQALESESVVRIESATGLAFRRPVSDYEARVSQFGSGSLGTYWPKDIQRILGLRPKMKAHIAILDEHAVLVRFDPEEAPA